MKKKKKVISKTSKKNTSNQKKSPTIFVQIASYRDPELIPTLKDCLAKAAHPENIRFGIGWQHSPYDEWDTLTEFENDSRFKIISVDYRNARGPCWIRHQINNLYEHETYALQLDSHHRFEQNWDTILIEMLESIRSVKCPRPLLSSYLPSFDPANDPASRLEAPWIMEFDRFAPEGPVHFLPHTIDEWKELDKPVPARFISGHFIFADGSFVVDVPYDPEYYFHGEEINLSVRAYMAGYDLFAPHRTVIWHEYHRNGKAKHWDDNPKWLELDKHSHAHNRTLLGIDEKPSDKTLTKHRRTLFDYEKYAGLQFSSRKVHADTLKKVRPPVSKDDSHHFEGLAHYHKICIDVHKLEFTENDYNVWAIAFEDESGQEIYRQDANESEIQSILSIPYEQDKFSHIWRNFYSDKMPVRWVVWPHSASKGWQNRLSGTLGR
jgi:hypothetical protein